MAPQGAPWASMGGAAGYMAHVVGLGNTLQGAGPLGLPSFSLILPLPPGPRSPQGVTRGFQRPSGPGRGNTVKALGLKPLGRWDSWRAPNLILSFQLFYLAYLVVTLK